MSWSSKNPASYAAARCWCEAAASASWSAREIFHSSAVSAACSPIESRVRGSAFCGIDKPDVAGPDLRQRGEPAPGVAGGVDLHQLLAQLVADRDGSVGGRVGAAGDTDVDLAERDLVGDLDGRLEAGAARLLDVGGGCLGESLEPSTLSRARLKSRACLSTAPATTSPSRSPSSPKRPASPSRVAVSMSWLDASA